MRWPTRTSRRVGVSHGCPAPWQLTRALWEGGDTGVHRHAAVCEQCALEMSALAAFAARAKAGMPAPEELSHDAVEQIAHALRGAIAPVAPARGRLTPNLIAAAVAALVLGGGLWGLSRIHPGLRVPPASHPPLESVATIRAIGPARFERAQVPPDEVVRLDEGSIELEVTPLRANQRFRVVTEDGEVEVHGTSFKVTAAQRRLMAVHVWRGRVSVRSTGGALAMLDAGDDWVQGAPMGTTLGETAPTTSGAGPAPEAAERAHPVKNDRTGAGVGATSDAEVGGQRRPATRVPASRALSQNDTAHASEHRDVSAGAEASFARAWESLRNGDAGKAAARFAEIEHLVRGSDLEEDVLYWRAVATGRAGDRAGARELFGAFLKKFPASPRAGEASVVLGWLLMQAGDSRGARRAFDRAAHDQSASVRSSAQEGLRRTQEEER